MVGPIGDFFMQPTQAHMICVAGGSGMAPIHSIVYDMLDKKIEDREIWYFFGARTLKDLFYLGKLRELEKKLPTFHFIPALSEPDAADHWKGEKGLVTTVLDKYLKTKIDLKQDREGYLCGSPGMIDACVKVMSDNKIDVGKIFYDKFA